MRPQPRAGSGGAGRITCGQVGRTVWNSVIETTGPSLANERLRDVQRAREKTQNPAAPALMVRGWLLGAQLPPPEESGPRPRWSERAGGSAREVSSSLCGAALQPTALYPPEEQVILKASNS